MTGEASCGDCRHFQAFPSQVAVYDGQCTLMPEWVWVGRTHYCSHFTADRRSVPEPFDVTPTVDLIDRRGE